MKKLLAALAFSFIAMPMMAGSALAHGCHHDVEEGKYGWHRHSRHGCDRIAVSPPRREWRGDRDRDHRRAPRCEERCKYIGPFKECKRVCD